MRKEIGGGDYELLVIHKTRVIPRSEMLSTEKGGVIHNHWGKGFHFSGYFLASHGIPQGQTLRVLKT